MDKRVCVLIVTYNRKEYLKNLIENGLMKQTHLIDEIIIFDNCSSDGTAEILLKSNIIKTAMPEEICENSYNGVRILYYLNKTNDGGSGGFYGGIKIALGEGCDYVWVMDDDVVPDPNCLKILLKSISETNKVVIPCRTDDFFSDSAIVDVNMSNPFLFSVRARKTKVDSKDIKGDSIIVKDMPFEGPLFDVSVIKKIGLPRKELFIFFDDSEYAYRASQVTNIVYVKDAILHKQIIPKKELDKLMGWRAYYAYRNQYWFDRTYGKNIFVKILRPLLNHLNLTARAVLKRKWSNLRVLNKAYVDGTKGILGRTVIPGQKL